MRKFERPTIAASVLAILVTAASASGNAAETFVRTGARAVASIEIQGTAYESACSKTALATLKKQMFEEKFEKEQELWRLVQIILCGDPTAANVRAIRNAVTARISTLNEGTGQDPVTETLRKRDVNVRDRFFKQGVAYSASVSRDGKGAGLSYHTDEACVEGPDFKIIGGKWRIVGLGSACD